MNAEVTSSSARPADSAHGFGSLVRGASVSLVAWGHPSDPRTFSGYSRHLARALRGAGMLRGEYSLKDLRPQDLLHGAVSLGRAATGRWRPKVTRSWMWSRRGSEVLSKRIAGQLQRAGDRGPILQVGTLARIKTNTGPQCVLTDMSIPQACRDGCFDVGKLSRRALEEACAVQAEVLQHAKHVFTLTEWSKQSIVADFGLSASKVTPVYIGSNLDPPRDAVVKRPRQILFVGIDWDRKGGPEMLAAFKLLKRRVTDATLVIVGCAPQVDQPGVEVLGYLPPSVPANRDRISKLFAESACFCMLSDFEPLGNVFIEAYACGTPVIAYDRGSRAEIVEHEGSGLLCAERTPETVASAMERLLLDQDFRVRASLRARELASEKFHWSRVVKLISYHLCDPASPELETGHVAPATSSI